MKRVGAPIYIVPSSRYRVRKFFSSTARNPGIRKSMLCKRSGNTLRALWDELLLLRRLFRLADLRQRIIGKRILPSRALFDYLLDDLRLAHSNSPHRALEPPRVGQVTERQNRSLLAEDVLGERNAVKFQSGLLSQVLEYGLRSFLDGLGIVAVPEQLGAPLADERMQMFKVSRNKPVGRRARPDRCPRVSRYFVIAIKRLRAVRTSHDHQPAARPQ